MDNAMQIYNDKIIPLCESNESDGIDVSGLIEVTSGWNPVVLQYGDKSQFEKDLPDAIIINFCKTFAHTTIFPKPSIVAMTSILQKTSILGTVQRILLLHFTKIEDDVAMAGYYYRQVDKMRIKNVTAQDEIAWKTLATKVIQHPQIQGMIKESIQEFELSIPDDMEFENVDIILVDSITTMLRGFSGVNEIFINADHFQKKFDAFKVDLDSDVVLLDLLAKMDIISVTIHEISHVMIRKCAKNFNFFTPPEARRKGLLPNRHEFGRYNEIRLFKRQVDWFLSSETIDVNYLERFVDAIEKGHLLPTLPTGFESRAVKRASFAVNGLDLYVPHYLC